MVSCVSICNAASCLGDSQHRKTEVRVAYTKNRHLSRFWLRCPRSQPDLGGQKHGSCCEATAQAAPGWESKLPEIRPSWPGHHQKCGGEPSVRTCMGWNFRHSACPSRNS